MSTVSCVCPIDQGDLIASETTLRCSKCETTFPVVNGVPILLNEENSVFRISDFTGVRPYKGASGYGASRDQTRGLRYHYRKMARHLASAAPNIKHFDAEDAVAAVSRENPSAHILVIGAGEKSYTGDITYTDVAFGRHVNIICDAHDIPFGDEKFDLVIAVAVLEHVADPPRCVSEIWRVLKSDGCAYAVTPFLQPVHMREHDFSRFTHLGHRRLFRWFDEIESGLAGGPGMSASFIVRGTLLSVTDRHWLQSGLRLLGLLIAYPIRFLDVWFLRHQSAYDAAGATFFFGRKRTTPISDRDILGFYRGTN